MQNTNCPTVINCDVQNNLANSGLILSSSVTIQQNCGETGTVTNPTTPGVPTPAQPAQVQPITISAGLIPAITGLVSPTTIMWFILFVIIVIMSAGLLYWIFADDETVGGVSGGIGDGFSGYLAT
jgi:hypothetical protein